MPFFLLTSYMIVPICKNNRFYHIFNFLNYYIISLFSCLPVSMSTCLLFSCLPVYLPTRLPPYMSTYPFVHLYICLADYLPTCPLVYQFTYLSVYQPICLHVYQLYTYTVLLTSMHFFLSTFLPVYLFTCLYVYCLPNNSTCICINNNDL